MENLLRNEDALSFMLAGKAEVTLKSLKTGVSFGYRISKKVPKYSNYSDSEYIYLVNIVSGDNSEYAGIIAYSDSEDKYRFTQGNKGKLRPEDKHIQALIYVLNNLQRGKYDIEVQIYHCGRCGKCGRRLTTPESIITGLGPECAKFVGVPHPKNMRKSMMQLYK